MLWISWTENESNNEVLNRMGKEMEMLYVDILQNEKYRLLQIVI